MRRPPILHLAFWCATAVTLVCCVVFALRRAGSGKSAKLLHGWHISGRFLDRSDLPPSPHNTCLTLLDNNVDPLREDVSINEHTYELYARELVHCLALGSMDAVTCPVKATAQKLFARGYNFFQNIYYFHGDFIFVTSSNRYNATINLSAWALFSDAESLREWGEHGRFASAEERGFGRRTVDIDALPLACASLAQQDVTNEVLEAHERPGG